VGWHPPLPNYGGGPAHLFVLEHSSLTVVLHVVAEPIAPSWLSPLHPQGYRRRRLVHISLFFPAPPPPLSDRGGGQGPCRFNLLLRAALPALSVDGACPLVAGAVDTIAVEEGPHGRLLSHLAHAKDLPGARPRGRGGGGGDRRRNAR